MLTKALKKSYLCTCGYEVIKNVNKWKRKLFNKLTLIKSQVSHTYTEFDCIVIMRN